MVEVASLSTGGTGEAAPFAFILGSLSFIENPNKVAIIKFLLPCNYLGGHGTDYLRR